MTWQFPVHFEHDLHAGLTRLNTHTARGRVIDLIKFEVRAPVELVAVSQNIQRAQIADDHAVGQPCRDRSGRVGHRTGAAATTTDAAVGSAAMRT